jgi:hypothetical protein
MNVEHTECVACKSQIKRGARKCFVCGSKQDWTRLFDIGNTSLALLIAAFSVAALASDNLLRVFQFFSNQHAARLSASITNVGPSALSLFVHNDGPGVAILSGGVLCVIWPTKTSLELWVPSSRREGRLVGVRYPRPEETVGQYVYFYEVHEGGPVLVNSGEQQVVHLSFKEMLIDATAAPPQEDEVKSSCTVTFIHEDGTDDVVLDLLKTVEVSFFALDREDVKQAISAYEASHIDPELGNRE